MAVIALPASFPLRSVEWSLDRPAQVHRSSYTARRTVISDPWHGIWRAKVDLAMVQGEANFRAIRAFFAKLKGQINTFELPATEASQGVTNTTVASGGAAAAVTLVMAASRTVSAGMFATITLPSGNKQMVMITADSTGTTLTFEPPLRESAAVGATVALATPTCLVALSESSFGWNVGSWRRYGLSFSVEEAF